MSRSNPTANDPNPAQRFLEWRGGDGHLQWFDKQKKENVIVKLPFKCVVLDRLATVAGYNKRLKSGIYANEIRDTRTDKLIVKCFAAGVVAEGLWADIKDKVTSRANGGAFAMNVYIAYFEGPTLTLGAMKLSGCSVGPWFDFEKEHRKALYEKALVVTQGEPNTEGEIQFTPPRFSLIELSPETNARAVELDKQLQTYFDGYFKRTHSDRLATAPEAQADPEPVAEDNAQDDPPPPADPGEDDSVPF